MTRSLAVLTTLLGASLLAVAYYLGSYIWPAILIILFYTFWIFAFSRQWDWIHSPGLLLVFALAGLGFFLDLRPAVIIPGVFLSLAGWDLADFETRLRLAAPKDDTSMVQKQHFLRLGLALGIGLAMVLVAINFRLNIPFGWMAILSLLVAGGVGVLIYSLLKNDQA
jgi:hypothetical protein